MPSPPRCLNLVLASLPAAEFERLRPVLRTVRLEAKQPLAVTGEPHEFVYFPCGGMCSMVARMENGGLVELASIGREGIVNYLAGFGQQVASSDSMVQIPDDDMRAHVMTARDFKAEMSRGGPFREAVNAYMTAAHVFISASVACNALHEAEQRCARWMLMAHDRVAKNEFQLSHEFLAMMLGVRRPTATVIAGTMQKAGLISYRRGHMKIVDRKGLEEASCECYAAVAPYFEELQHGRED